MPQKCVIKEGPVAVYIGSEKYVYTILCFGIALSPNVAQNPKGTNVGVNGGANVAHLPTPKFARPPSF